VEILGYISHYRSLIWSDITYILNVEKRLSLARYTKDRGDRDKGPGIAKGGKWERSERVRSTVMSIFSAAEKASSKFLL